MDQAIGVSDGVELEYIAAQSNGLRDFAREKILVNDFVGIGGQYSQSNARVPVVETAPSERPVAVIDIHDSSGLGLDLRLFDHLLEDPRMVRAALDFKVDDGACIAVHCRMIADALSRWHARPAEMPPAPARAGR